MKMHITTAALVLATAPAFSQNAMMGVSHPDSAVISSTDDATQQTPVAKPSADVPAVAPASPAVQYGPYVPYKGATVAGSNMMTAEPSADDPDAMIVTSVPEREGTLREGTLLKVQIQETLATDKTVAGSRFTATVTEGIERNGRVIIPVGSILEGRVTEVRGGRRISGAALLHLETNDVTLPDGTHYIVHAQLIDTGKSEFNVNRRRDVKRKDHPKEMLAIAGGVTGEQAPWQER